MVSHFIILCGLFTLGLSNPCPSQQFVERMGTNTITCSQEGDIERCYWYLGSTAETDPILKLENQIKGGTKLQDAHYDITNNCEMRIMAAQLEHEATYTYVVFFSDGSYSTKDISVFVTITPKTNCPRISNCENCGNCSLKSPINETVTLLCYIDGIRPTASLQWSHNGDVTVISNSSQSVPMDPSIGTWNSSASIKYSLDCGETALLHCRSKGRTRNLSRTIQAKSEPCENAVSPGDFSSEPPRTTSPSKGSRLHWFGPCVAVIVVIAVVVVSAITIWYLRRHDSFTKALKTAYSANLVPDVDSLYSTFECLVEDDNRRTQSVTSEELLTNISQLKDSRLLFISDPGYGKTFFFNAILGRWIKGELMPGVILIYIPLKFLTKTSCILKELNLILQRKRKSVADLQTLLEQRESVLLLDGLTDLHSDEVSIDNVHQCRDAGNCLFTVENLLKRESDAFPKMKLWVSSRPTEDRLFEEPYRLINLVGFNNKQKDEYLQRADEFRKRKEINNTNHTRHNPHNDESALLIPETNILELWGKIYGNNRKSVSPLVAHLFALNLTALTIPNSKCQTEVHWDTDGNKVNVSNIDWHLFACLYDSSSQDEWKKSLTRELFQDKDVIFERGKDGYQRDAVLRLCLSCRELGVEPKTLIFCKDYPSSLNKYLPKIQDELIFKSLRLNKDDIIIILSDSAGRVNTVRFVNCKLPTMNIDGSKEMEYPKVFREEGDQKYVYDFEANLWLEEPGIAEESI